MVDYQKIKRRNAWQKHPRCLICGEPFNARAWDYAKNDFRSNITKECGVHRRCDNALWLRTSRRLKNKSCQK